MSRSAKMKPLDEEIERIKADIARLQTELGALVRYRSLVSGEVAPQPEATRKRSPNIKPAILDIMRLAESAGATSADVFAKVKATAPTVSRDTIGSILSRLKSDGALAHDGERYYDAKYAPKDVSPFRVISAAS